ncbi:MAG: RNA polymerase sigma-70 factor [Rikenellaceae bacterium]|nr:RNA polymerase sigma-70 factor [Rikenellaceae bacterium]
MPLSQPNIPPHEQQRFEELYKKYKPRFITLARSYVRNIIVAEDIVMDSFVAYWERRETIDRETVLPYLFTVIKNKSLNWLRRENARIQKNASIYSERIKDIEININSLNNLDTDLLFASEIQEIVDRVLERMPEKTRLVFLENRDNGLTYKEIAEKLDISYRQVDYEMQKALTAFRGALKDYLLVLLIVLNFSRE